MKIRYVLCVLLCNLVCCLMAAAHSDFGVNSSSRKSVDLIQESRTSYEELAELFEQKNVSMITPIMDCPTTPPTPKRERVACCPTSPDKDCPTSPSDCPTSPIKKRKSVVCVLVKYLNNDFYQRASWGSAQ